MPDDYDYENLVVARDGGVVRVELDSTSKMNALNRRMTEELVDLTAGLADGDVRCLVLTGSDGVFCAGGDVTGFEGEAPAAGFRKGASQFHDAVLNLYRAETPVVTGVNGPAVGAGFSLALLGDLVVVADGAYFQFGYPRVGLTGDGGITYTLPRIVGLRAAKRIALLNEPIDPGEAVALGIANEVVPDGDLDDRLGELAGRVADGPTVALGRTLRLLDGSLGRSAPEQLAAETDGMAHAARTDDFREGVAAFAADREPEFEGR